MLEIAIPARELWDEVKEEFVVDEKEQTLELEHSLVSISKWESKWCKPFLSNDEKTVEETVDYIKCMTITKNVKPSVYSRLTNDNIKQIRDYIDAPMTATTFSDRGSSGRNRDIITSEIIYYWMVTLQIPQEYQKWHLNRLLTLIRVCNIKNQPEKKMGKRELMSRNAALNAERRAKLHTNG